MNNRKHRYSEQSVNLRNRATSAHEVSEFFHNPPNRYFLYINEPKHEAQTWMGDKLGNVRFGREYQSNLGDIRQPITVYGINGVNYHGTYYKSNGDYARIRAVVNQTCWLD